MSNAALFVADAAVSVVVFTGLFLFLMLSFSKMHERRHRNQSGELNHSEDLMNLIFPTL
jgi:membrane protein implicated in regulation of membrane protease activity